MPMSVVKAGSANWIVFAYDCICLMRSTTCSGFSQAGIVDVLKNMDM